MSPVFNPFLRKPKWFACLLSILITGVSATAAATTAPSVYWSKQDMVAAVKGLGYPKPHAKKIVCHGRGRKITGGNHSIFQCVATYKHHRLRRFWIGGIGVGGWVCAGKTSAACQSLRHGFQPADIGESASLAAQGYAELRYKLVDTYYAPCPQGLTPTPTSCFAYSGGRTLAVTVTVKKVGTLGYRTSGTARLVAAS